MSASLRTLCKHLRFYICGGVFLSIGGVCWANQVVVYPAPAGLQNDPEYKVEVNGKEVFVYGSPIAGLASFNFEGPVQVLITPRRDPKWVDVRPLHRKIPHTEKNGQIRLTLDKPGNFSIELNKHPKRHPLFLFANPLEKNAPRLHRRRRGCGRRNHWQGGLKREAAWPRHS